ncbi:MAG: TonB-dependent receptor [Rhodothermaceae bacterium]|nr:MAG: TonB-dependent receptor [Rhodothermaceae bacterium]
MQYVRGFLFLFSGLMLAGSVYAQAGLEVTVLHFGTRAPVPGVTVYLENEAIGYGEADVTNEQGKVRFPAVTTAGLYDVYVPASDTYYEARADDIRLRANYTRSIILLLVPVRTIELGEVTVTAQTSFAEINTVNAEVGATLREQEVELLPVEGRDVTRVLYRLPNVTQATGFFPEAPNVSVNGANSLYANYMIDGMDNNENFLGGQKFAVPTGFVQDITVLTNNYSTEFGRTGNGVFNITTKSGSNRFSGEAFYLMRPGPALDGAYRFAQRDLSGNPVKDGFMRQQGGVAFGGPIRRDRTFFFVNVEHTTDFKDNLLRVPQLGLTETVEGQNHFTYTSARIDHRWSDRLRSTVRANVGLVQIERQGGGLEGGTTFPSAANTQDRNSVLVALMNTYTGDGFVAETNLQYSRFRWNYARASDGPQVSVLDPQELSVAVLGHPGFLFDDLENTFQVQQKLTATRGNHTFKLGAELVSSDFSLTGGGNPNGNYTVKLTQAQLDQLRAMNRGKSLRPEDLVPLNPEVLNYSVELRPKAFGARQNIWSFYVEDLVSASDRLNLTFGLRYDYDNLSKGGGTTGDWNNLAPRFSFNYKLDERSALRGGYGIFYDKIVYAIYSDALQQNSTAEGFKQQLRRLIELGLLPSHTDLDRVTFEGNLTADFQGVPYLGGPTPEEVRARREDVFSNERRILNPDGYDNPYTHQFSLGYQLQLGPDRLFYVDLMHTRSYNLFRLRNLNAPAPYRLTRADIAGKTPDELRALVRTPAEADATRPVGPVAGGARNIVMTETAGEARYWAASFNLLKDRGGDDFAYRLSYTLSRLRNNTEDINFRAMDANDFEAEWGPSINDRTHVINAIFYYYPVRNLGLSVAALLQSGQPINRIPDATLFGTTDLNGDGRSFGDAYVGNSDRQPGEGRNSDRLPWSNTFDVGLQYRLPVRGGHLEFRADVFNIFNAENLSGYTNNATQSNQIQVGPADSGVLVRRNASPPRQFQFGLRYVF